MSDDYNGRIINERYQIERLLGEGGMGAVYLGRHVTVGKKVAIKFLHAQFTNHENLVKRFLREAQITAEIAHKNIVDVVDMGVSSEGEPFLVMEFLEGESLGEMLERTGPLDLPAACAIMEPVLLALGAAHEKGIIHRDLKPDNIFISPNPGQEPTVKVIDFGISKFKEPDNETKLTQTGTILGTPSYMAPEQARGVGEIDQRADLYSMGVIFYEMLTGGMPFSGQSYSELLVKVLTEPPIPPSVAYENFPEVAEPLINRALAKDPNERYASADEMVQALADLTDFEQRRMRLTHYAAGIEKTHFAIGDLGGDPVDFNAGTIAADLLGAMTNFSPAPDKKDSRKKNRMLAAAIVIIIVILAIVVSFIGTDSQSEKKVLSADQVAGVKLPSVRITIRGIPKGADVYYDGSLVPKRTFRVRKEDTIVPIEVKKEGWETAKISVVPSSDKIVEVKMTPLPKPETQTEESTDVKKSPQSPKKKSREKQKKSNPFRKFGKRVKNSFGK